MIVVLNTESPTESSGQIAPQATDNVFVMYWNGEFFDSKGKIIDPSAIEPVSTGHMVLVVAPSSTLKEIVRAKSLLSADDAVVTEMNDEWVRSLSKRSEQL